MKVGKGGLKSEMPSLVFNNSKVQRRKDVELNTSLGITYLSPLLRLLTPITQLDCAKMFRLALKMLIGNRSSCIGVIFGVFLATLLISQQSSIFLGLISRSYRFVTDISSPTIWVIDPATESESKLRTMPASYLDLVRSTSGIDWAVPLSSSITSVVTNSGIFDLCLLYGIDDATLIGAPTQMIEGNVLGLRHEGGIIVDIYSAHGSLAHHNPDGTKVPLKTGDTLEINGRRAVVVGLCKVTPGFYPQPIIFTSKTQYQSFIPTMINRMGFILVKTLPGTKVEKVCEDINRHHGLLALTRAQIESRVVDSFLKTGILINFGLSVALGIIIGFSITGQIFYVMTLENIMYFALIKSIGGTKKVIMQMIILQASIVGVIGFLLGTGATFLWGIATKNTTLAFLFPWQLLLFSALIVMIICIFTAALSIQKVFRVDPKVLMGN